MPVSRRDERALLDAIDAVGPAIEELRAARERGDRDAARAASARLTAAHAAFWAAMPAQEADFRQLFGLTA